MRRALIIIVAILVAVAGVELATHHKGPRDFCGYFAKDCPSPSPSRSAR